MALNPKLAVARRNSALDNILASANNGILRIYDGAQPANADTAITTQTLLAELVMSATAFAAASGGVSAANAISNDAAANNTGTATWFRLFQSDGVTVILDGSAGISGTNLVINSASIVANAIVSVTSFTITFPA